MLPAALDDAFVALAESANRASALIRARAALSRREGDVLRGLADGLSDKGIALRLGISPRTVEIHIRGRDRRYMLRVARIDDASRQRSSRLEKRGADQSQFAEPLP